jgi:hypothetical protein
MHYILPKDRTQTSIMQPRLDEMIGVDADVRILDLLITEIVGQNPGKFRYKGKVVAIDGTKLKANANREMLTRSGLEKRLSRMADEMEDYLSELEERSMDTSLP